MINRLSCEWMSLKLSSPIVVASLTPFSKARIEEHINFISKAISFGAGAVVLPSINPSRHGSSEMNEVIIDTQIINTGIRKNDAMAFSLLGPTVPNIVSIEYGLKLALESKRTFKDFPIIASIACIGNDEIIVDVVSELVNTHIDGIELNCSCPNAETLEGDFRGRISVLISRIREVTNIPLSLKISPYYDYSKIIYDNGAKINGITISNAYIGLVPPSLNNYSFSPYKKTERWAPGGIYGPFEKELTFYQLYGFKEIAKELSLDIACVGGIVNGDDAVQAILLGATIVEISSGIVWNGLQIIKRMNEKLVSYLDTNNSRKIIDIRGKALFKIEKCADDLSSDIKHAVSKIDHKKCHQCVECNCLNRLCFALYRDGTNKIQIDSDLCSGCGWCVSSCMHKAIELEVLE